MQGAGSLFGAAGAAAQQGGSGDLGQYMGGIDATQVGATQGGGQAGGLPTQPGQNVNGVQNPVGFQEPTNNQGTGSNTPGSALGGGLSSLIQSGIQQSKPKLGGPMEGVPQLDMNAIANMPMMNTNTSQLPPELMAMLRQRGMI
jgi:hypothetical protein